MAPWPARALVRSCTRALVRDLDRSGPPKGDMLPVMERDPRTNPALHVFGALGLSVILGLGCTSKKPPPPSDAEKVALGIAGTTTGTTTGTTAGTTSTSTMTIGAEAEHVPMKPQLRLATIAASREHVCALLPDGEVACWGAGHGGQVAPGIVENQARPVKVPGIKGAIALSVNSRMSCALHSDGEIACWGTIANQPQNELLRTRRLGKVIQMITDGYGDELCGLRADGTVACLDGAGDIKTAPRMLDIDDALSLSRGRLELCALRANKSLVCWNTHSGEDGYQPVSIAENVVEAENSGGKHCYRRTDGSQLCSSYKGYETVSPVQGPLWKAKAPPELWGETIDYAGAHGIDCIRDRTGTVKCKGSNEHGELGNGRTGYSPTPRPFFGIAATSASTRAETANIVGLELGCTLSCVRLGDGGLRCIDRIYPWDDPKVAGVRSISISSSHACAVVGGGQLRCWGDNYEGQLGVKGEFDGLARVAGISNAARVATGIDHTCASRQDGAVFCWGSGDYGALGNGRHLDMDDDGDDDNDDDGIMSATPLLVKGVPSSVRDLALGQDFSCAATKGGLYCWGILADATGGEDPIYDTATLVSPVDASMIRAAGNSLCALDAEGVVRCLGDAAQAHVRVVEDEDDSDNDEDDVLDFRDNPEPFADGGPLWRIADAPREVIDIAVGESHACVLAAAGTVHCWGDNTRGQLGNGNSRKQEAMVQVTGLRGIVEIDAGDAHTCARRAESVECWGKATAPKEDGASNIASAVVGIAPYLTPDLVDQGHPPVAVSANTPGT